MKKIVVFGGSFNPVHEGHLKIAEDAFSFVNADKLLFVPSLNHPTKNSIVVNQAHILNMLKISISSSINSDDIEIEPYELEKFDKISYTYDTVKYLKLKYPDSQLYLVIGSDNLSTITNWYKYDELKKLVKFVVGERLGFEIKNVKDVDFVTFKTLAPQISSSEVRDLIASQKDVSSYLDIDVLSYIEEKKLYR